MHAAFELDFAPAPPPRARTSPTAIVVRDELTATPAERVADAALRLERGDVDGAITTYAAAIRAALSDGDVCLAAAALDGALAAAGVPDDADAWIRAQAALDHGIAREAVRVWDALAARGGRVRSDALRCIAALRWEAA